MKKRNGINIRKALMLVLKRPVNPGVCCQNSAVKLGSTRRIILGSRPLPTPATSLEPMEQMNTMRRRHPQPQFWREAASLPACF